MRYSTLRDGTTNMARSFIKVSDYDGDATKQRTEPEVGRPGEL